MYIALAGAAGIAAGAAAHTAYARMLSAPVADDFGKTYAPLRITPDNESPENLARRNALRIDALEYYIYRLHKELNYSVPGSNPFEDRKEVFEAMAKRLAEEKAATARNGKQGPANQESDRGA
jgi:hypothetical protein